MKFGTMTGLIAVLATIALPGVLLAQTSTNREIQGVQTKSVYDTLAATGKHKTLLALIDRAGLKERISPTLIEDKTSELVTVFAPTDDAFAKVPKNIMDKLNSDPKLLEQVLLYHIASGKLGVSNLTDGLTPVTQEGETVKIKVEDGVIWVNGAKVVGPETLATSGIVHTIDLVLIPPKVAEAIGGQF